VVDDQQYHLGLRAQRSQFHAALVRIMSQIKLDYPTAHTAWDEYLRSFKAEELLPELPVVNNDQLRFFLSANNVYATYYNIKSAEEMLPKYRIKAPFSGVVTQGNVSAGSVVAPGTPLAQFSRTDVYELKAAISSAQVDLLKAGQKIQLRHGGTDQEWTGTVNRIGQTIDPATQAVPVFIRLSGRGLRAGLFLEATLATNSFDDVVALPNAAINRNNQVHLIQDGTVRLQDIEPIHYADNKVWVKGLKNGQVVITESTIDPIVGTKAKAK
ncbi:MAG: HlyD family secretion protein, partial [Bacteroidota bacterium]